MASAQSGSLQSAPGYVARPSSKAVFTPSFPTLGALPTVAPIAGDASTPGYVGRQLLAGQLGALPGQQSAALTQIQAGAKQALTGYGGYSFGVDDPSTPQDESLLLSYDASKGMGQREQQAAAGARNTANSAGMLESSFANQNIASAVQRTSLEAQAIANQYAASVNSTLSSYSAQAASIAGQWAGLYGSDSAWMVDHPPPPPVPAAPAPAAPPETNPGIPAALWSGPQSVKNRWSNEGHPPAPPKTVTHTVKAAWSNEGHR